MVSEHQVIAPMSQEDFEAARHVTLDPVACLRCGRRLFSRASVVRGYGSTCALLQALEELSHGPRNPEKAFKPKPIVDFYEVADGHWEISDHRNLVIGELKQTKGGTWNIYLWGKRLDLDADLSNAKRRVSRLLERMS